MWLYSLYMIYIHVCICCQPMKQVAHTLGGLACLLFLTPSDGIYTVCIFLGVTHRVCEGPWFLYTLGSRHAGRCATDT